MPFNLDHYAAVNLLAKVFRQLILLLCFTGFSLQAALASDIIINAQNQQQSISRNELLSIFSMRQRYWRDGTPVTVFVLKDANAHSEFCKKNLRIFPHQLRSRWDRLVYSGTGVAPTEVDSVDQLIQRVAQIRGAIGYINRIIDNDNVKKISVR